MRTGWIAGLLFLSAGCSAVDVGPELDIMAKATAETSRSSLALVDSNPEGERQARLDAMAAAAAAGKARAWTFRGDCGPIPRAVEEPGGCVLERGSDWDAVQQQSIRRKLAVIDAYVDALASMANAKNDAALVAAYGSAVGAFGELATAAEIEGMKALAKDLQESRAAVGEVTTFLLANRRARLLKTTVLRHRDDFTQVVEEIIDGLSNLTSEDEALTASRTALDLLLREAMAASAAGDIAGYRAALDRADRAHAGYLSARDRSVFARLAAVAAAHDALARRLARPASPEEILKFTKALAALKGTLSQGG